jgi:D-alanyl-D-alanine carboxypeptidase/D-alanyl-D-alanine-endopeptidase (penicillin-binding protein 4)
VAPLAARLERLLDAPAFASAAWGADVRVLENGVRLYARDAERAFTPASVAKLFVSAAALDAWGPQERVRTTVESDGVLAPQGRLVGDLVLVGRGEANLSARFENGNASAAFERLANALYEAGVRRVEGRLLGDESAFSGPRRGADWPWEDLVWWYGAEVSALSFNDNCVMVTVIPGGRVGAPAQVALSPRSAYVTLDNQTRTGAPGSAPELTLERTLGGNHILLGGSYPLGAAPRTLAVALEDPARFAVTVFAEVLNARGIQVVGGIDVVRAPAAPARQPVPVKPRRVWASFEGPPLLEDLVVVNKRSQNLHAELLLRRLGLHAGGAGTSADGQAALRAFAARAGLPAEGFELRDAAGLSSANSLTPAHLTGLLAFMARHPHAAAFMASLPVAGVDGTLEGRGRGTALQGRVLAKTGTLTHVHTLAGYLTRRDGTRLVFALLLNQYLGPTAQAHAAQDAFLQALAE